MTSNEYMYLHSSMCKTPLIATHEKDWTFVLHDREYFIPKEMEQYYAFLLAEGRCGQAAATLRCNYDDVSPSEIEAFFQYFYTTHPLTVETCYVSDMPLYATPEHPLRLPNPFNYIVELTPEQEKELLDMIALYKHQYWLNQWFCNYVSRYGLRPRYKRDINTQYAELAYMFCAIHGINYDHIDKVQAKYEEKLSVWEQLKSGFVFMLMTGVVFFLAWRLITCNILDMLPAENSVDAINITVSLGMPLVYSIFMSCIRQYDKLTMVLFRRYLAMDVVLALIWSVLCIPVCFIASLFAVFENL